jgi:hypothetical protein
MNTIVTRQDLQLQLQQTINTILSKTMSRDEFNNIVLSITQRMCTKQDAQSYIEYAKQKTLERLTIPNTEQLAFHQQVSMQLDMLNKTLARLELKLDSVQKTISVMRAENKTVMGRNQNNPARTVLEQLYA